jgi:hypothetical protein
VRKTRIRSLQTGVLFLAALFICAGTALAGDDFWTLDHWLLVDARHASLDAEPSLGERWLNPVFQSEEQHGFEYSRSLAVNLEKKLVFSIQGPLIKDRAPGLAFELRF